MELDILVRHGTVIDCKGLVVTAGFWNSHVHVLMPGLLHAEKLSPEVVTSQLQAIFTRWGFTTVFDIASVLQNTTLIRRRIERGQVKGLRILTVGEPSCGRTTAVLLVPMGDGSGLIAALDRISSPRLGRWCMG